MKGGEVIRRARRRAGLSQAELAGRLATKQPVVARWETGARAPTLETVARAVEACGLALDIAIVERDLGEEALLREWQSLSPTERGRRNRQMLETERWLQTARPRGTVGRACLRLNASCGRSQYTKSSTS